MATALILAGCESTGPSKAEKDAELDQAISEHNETATAKEKIVCKYERETGSHFKTKVCRTVAQMEEDREDARKMLDRGGIAPGGGDN